MKRLPAVEYHPFDFVAGELGNVHRHAGSHSGEKEWAAPDVGDEHASGSKRVLD